MKEPVPRVVIAVSKSILIVGFMGVVLGTVAFVMSFWLMREQIYDKQRLLLYETDHRSVLSACRELMKNTSENDSRSLSRRDFPQVIRQLGPSWVMRDKDRVHIEMGGGFFHYGLTCFRNSLQGQGLKQLIPGLWYESEDSRVIAPGKSAVSSITMLRIIVLITLGIMTFIMVGIILLPPKAPARNPRESA